MTDENETEAAKPARTSSEDPPAFAVREPQDRSDPVEHVEEHSFVPPWELIAGSIRGKGHAHLGQYREDAVRLVQPSISGGPYWWAICVGDGAGSASLSRLGSRTAVDGAARSIALDGLSRPDVLVRNPAALVRAAALRAIEAVEGLAADREMPVREFHTTLLILLHVEEPGKRPRLVSFQAGDGLILGVTQGGDHEYLGEPDDTGYACETLFLNSEKVKDTLLARVREDGDASRFPAFLVMTDGISEDLLPLEKNLPTLLRGVYEHGGRLVLPNAERLVGLLGYEKPGSFDDRTLALATDRGSYKSFGPSVAGEVDSELKSGVDSEPCGSVQRGDASEERSSPVEPPREDQSEAAGSTRCG